MSNKKTILRILAVVLGLTLFMASAAGFSAYFMGLRGVGVGWPAAIGVFTMMMVTFLFILVVAALGLLGIWWIVQSAKKDPKPNIKIRKLETNDIYEVEGVKFQLRWWSRHSGGVMDPRDSELNLHLEMLEK